MERDFTWRTAAPHTAALYQTLLAPNHARRAELPDRLAKGRAALAVMDEHLKSRSFFVAERYTIADIALYAYTHVADEGGHDLGPYSNVRSWLSRVCAQPGHVGIYTRPRSLTRAAAY